MEMPPGYDEWKTEGGPEYTAAEEAAAIEADHEEQENLREQIALALEDYRGSIFLATIRQIVVEELNKLKPGPDEPLWQTKNPVTL